MQVSTYSCFIVEPDFCERDKNHKFHTFRTYKNLFFNKVAFCFIWLLHCVKRVRISLYSAWMREKCGHVLRSVVLQKMLTTPDLNSIKVVFFRQFVWLAWTFRPFRKNFLDPLDRTLRKNCLAPLEETFRRNFLDPLEGTFEKNFLDNLEGTF